ncbi:protein scarlet-like isoform X2 [Periplaneta americana]|uniref:protein scarlet-like isoform X2 n=1 Tax=Periplaneta americana TaxID=6978 RepID=UPI0037E9C2E4
MQTTPFLSYVHATEMENSCSVEMSESVMRFVETSPLLGNQEFDLTLSWQNVTVSVKRKKSAPKLTTTWLKSQFIWKKTEHAAILDNVSGNIRSGNLIAVMGSSGCGKTSLLAAVSKRIKGKVSGKILLCDRPVDGSLLTKISGFVPQKDIAIETLTTKEHLQFMSWMRLDRELCSNTRSMWIQTLFSDLNLVGCEDTPISALSGGERRRLSLAVELLTDPPLLFCDEPTTGLDTYNASTVVEKLRVLASRGKAVLCSIHQPPSDILSCFHKIILLAAGKVAFQGTLTQAHTFFSSQGLVCPLSYNPAEFYIQQLSIVPGKEDESLQRIHCICEAFSTSNQDEYLQLSMPHIQAARNSITEISNDFQKYVTMRKIHWHTQAYWLTWRSIVDSRRNKSGHSVQVAVFLVVSVMLTLCFMNTEVGTQSWIQNIRGLLYLIISEVFFTSAYVVFNTFPREIPVFLIESGLYSASAYYFSKMVTLIPRTVIEPLIFLGIIFVLVDFVRRDIIMYLTMAVPVVLVANSATAYVPIDLISLIMAGIFYNIRALPASIIWLKYLSQFYYSNEALAVLHWQEVGQIRCSNDTSLPCLENGQEILDEYGFETENLFKDLTALAIFYIVLHFVGFLSVWRRSKKSAAY